jgi:cell division transport system permease protein
MWSYFVALKRNWAQHFISQSSGLIILFVTYSAALLVAMALFNLQQVFDQWGQVGQMIVYLEQSSDPQEMVETLGQDKSFSDVRYVSAQESSRRFSQQFNEAGLENLSADKIKSFFPSYLEITLAKALSGAQGISQLEGLAQNLKERFPQVSEVKFGKDWLNRYLIIFKTTKGLGWFFIFIFILASVVVSSSVIKTLIFNRREELEVLDFIGADDRQIYVPQILSAMITGNIAFCLAAASMASLVYMINTQVSGSSLVSTHLAPTPLMMTLLIWAICMFATFMSSFFTIYRILPRTVGSNDPGLGDKC